MVEKSIKIKLKKGLIGCTKRQRACIRGLGLGRIGQERSLENTPAVRGLIKKVIHLLEVNEAG